MERYGVMICSGTDILHFWESSLSIPVSVFAYVPEKSDGIWQRPVDLPYKVFVLADFSVCQLLFHMMPF